MQSEQLRNGSSVRLGDLGMMVLQFFGGLVSVPLATILGALVIGLGGLYDEGLGLGAYAGLILALAGLAWFSFRRRAWMLLMGGITAAALQWYFAYELRLRHDAREITMTLTATRATGTVRPTSSPTLRFLGGVGMMLLAITVG